jgi:folate-binding protein YgfZ
VVLCWPRMDRPAFLLDFREWGVVRITGPDAREFLQGVGTQEVAALRGDAALPTLFLTEKGRPVALAWAVLQNEGAGAILFVEPGGRDSLIPHLDRLRVMEEVAFTGPQGMPRLYGVAGRDRDSVAREWAATLPGSEVFGADPVSFLLLPPGAKRPGSVANVVASAMTPEAAEAWRIAVGIPRAGVDFDMDRIATELSLPEAISLTKGCFVGQEVVARTTNRGAVRRRRIGFHYPRQAGVLPRGTELWVGGGSSGFVTSTALEPGTGRGLGMGYLSTEAPQGPGEVAAIQGTVMTHLEVAPWPLL